jgi:hypothetical protein
MQGIRRRSELESYWAIDAKVASKLGVQYDCPEIHGVRCQVIGGSTFASFESSEDDCDH